MLLDPGLKIAGVTNEGW